MANSTGLGIFEGLVDRIVVLGLLEATERRERLPQHLAKFGITRFEWHDAFNPDHPAVQELYENDLVTNSTSCFRCGKEQCDCKNNTLIPAQIANFASHLDIWQTARDLNKRTLVLEDDVLLHPWARRVARQLRKRIKNGKIEFGSGTEMLLRLGWAKSIDHQPFRKFRISTECRMSNPCYALTPVFADKLLKSFTKVDTTSDIFMHKVVANESNSLTILPPMASELSWSEGSLDSHIHPKENRLEYLAKRGRLEEKAEHERRLRQHVKYVFNRPILCVGHPRTGTGYVAELCTRAGLDVGHEKGGRDGISSWMFAVDADENPWALDPVARTRRAVRWQLMIQTVRDPETAIPSIMRENQHAPASYDFRRTHIREQTGVELNDFETEIEKAVTTLCLWARIIRKQNPDFVFHIERDAEALIDFLLVKGFEVNKANLDIGPVNSEKLYKGIHHEKPQVSLAEWEKLGNECRDFLAEYCDLYGYKNPLIPIHC